MSTEQFYYGGSGFPPHYKCEYCGSHGVRIYREYNVMYTDLCCTCCAEKRERKKAGPGFHSLGFRVPAVPTEEDAKMWCGFLGTPDEGRLWWESLPIT